MRDLSFSAEVSMYDTERDVVPPLRVYQKETSLYARWFQKREPVHAAVP